MPKRDEKWLKDSIDRSIIKELQRNARQSTSTIAARLNVARSTVHERIARMERDRVITGYSVVLSRNPAEDGVQALMLLQIRQQDTRKILAKLANFAEIRVCLSISGEFDLFVSIEAPMVEDLDVLVDEIAEIPGVLRTTTHVVFGRRFDRRYKETTSLITAQLMSGEDDA